MKIIIKDENGQLTVCTESEKPIPQSQIWATLSLALESLVADSIRQKNIPADSKKEMIEVVGEMVAATVKGGISEIAGSSTKGVTFYDKEASFMSKVLGL